MIRSRAEFLEWQGQARTYWSLRRKGWLHGPEGFCRRLYAGVVRGERELNLESPTSFCDKLNWMKFHYRPPEFRTYVDKFAVRDHVARTLGTEWLIPLLGTWERPEQIPWDDLPNAFVLKTNHGSGTNVLCADKARFDRSLAARRLRRWLRRDFYWYGLEWCYRDMPRKILGETFLQGPSGQPPWDYKVLCFGGEPRIVWVDLGRFTQHRRIYYDVEWNRLACGSSWYAAAEENVPRPACLAQLLAAARALAGRHPFMRVDFYVVADRPLFGEITIFPGGGFEPFLPLSFDEEVGSWIPLPNAGNAGGAGRCGRR